MNEVAGIPLPKTVKKSLRLKKCRIRRAGYNDRRTVLSTNLPLCFKGASPPRPDPSHPPTVAGGMMKRFGYGTPPLNRAMKRQFRRFVILWLRKNIDPLVDSDIPSLGEWLESTPYSQGRKAELMETYNKFVTDGNDFKDFRKVKSFIKDETYPEYKYPRLINSRVDAAKCYFGPAVQAVSDRLFSQSWFIKKVPVPERPKVLRASLLSTDTDEDYIYTDYTAFEAHFTKEIMEITQFELFRHMLKNTTGNKEWFAVYCSILGGKNKITMKDFDATIEATRMSGEMDTSLSNGFSNLMLFLFVCYRKGATSVKGFVEGDDGIFKVSPASAAPTESDFADLGFTIKIGHTKELSEASFCGQVYDMTDLIVVTDPLEAISRLGYTSKKYTRANHKTRMMLLRARGFSYVYQYNGCPLLYALGVRILELTEGYDIEERIFLGMDQWERDKLRAATANKLPEPVEIGDATRALVHRLYGLSPVRQLELEKYFSKIELGVHESPFQIDEIPQVWRDYYNNYSVSYYNPNPVWLLRPEQSYLDRLGQFECCDAFVRSL